VWVVDRDAEAGAATVNSIAATGGTAKFAALDVSDATAALALAAEIPAMDVLVNNAGIGHVGNLENTTADDLDRLHAVNVRGPFNLCKAFVPAMLERRSGSVVMLASIGGVLGVRDRLAYTVSKHAVVGLTRCVALESAATGVTVNAICPGFVQTDMVETLKKGYASIAGADGDKAVKAALGRVPIGRVLDPSEIASLAIYLGSRESGGMTGQSILIDGGMLMC
jgi:NAD(P)-dependent dehydrogenase (short-subunit alcohol dehydrogenase family)